MADEIRHTMSRRARVRAAEEAGTLDSLPADVLREEVDFRVSAGLLKAPKGRTRADHVAALSGAPAPARTAPAKAAPKSARTTRPAETAGTATTPTQE